MRVRLSARHLSDIVALDAMGGRCSWRVMRGSQSKNQENVCCLCDVVWLSLLAEMEILFFCEHNTLYIRVT